MLTRKSPISCDNAPIKGDSSEPKVYEPTVREPSVRFRFKREEHLKGRKEIRAVFDKGKQFSVWGAKLFVLKNNLSHNRICFSFSRGFGNAVIRNRVRRHEREAFRLLKMRLCGGHDLILLAYRDRAGKSPDFSGKTVLNNKAVQLETLFKKAGLLK